MKDYREFDETSPESQDDTKELVSGIEEFINTFKNSSNVKELIDSYSSDFMFMPLSTVMARDMLKLYGDEFTKVHLLWMLALNCNYQINNVCVTVSKENLSKLILNRYLDNTPDSEDNHEDIADKKCKIEEFVKEFAGGNTSEEISKTICYALDFPDKFEEKFRLIQLKHKIGSHDSIQWINAQGTLIHEYWCMGKDGCKKENGTISVGLKINDNKQYVLSVFSKGNHPDKFERMICDYCNKSDLLISDRDLSYLIDISTDDESIVEFINILLQKMKEYRETDFPV